MTHKMKPPGAWVRRAASGSSVAGSDKRTEADTTPSTPSTQLLAATWLTRRFGLQARRAMLVAHLAGLGGA